MDHSDMARHYEQITLRGLVEGWVLGRWYGLLHFFRVR
jgi:hypothetical protein